MLLSNTVQSNQKGKERLRQAMSEVGLTQDQLAKGIKVSVDTIKRLLGSKHCPNGIERRTITAIVDFINKEVSKKYNKQTVIIRVLDIVDSKGWCNQQLPLEFESLIEEKTQGFSGRKVIFKAFKEFLNNNPNGYFTVVGDPGMGKSAFAAKYVKEYYSICYFNIFAEGRNRPELFLESICKQLISRYSLVNMEDANLPTLLAEVSRQKLSSTESLVIVVDALDEVEQELEKNILYLPTTLPDHVYFLLTRRPYLPNMRRLSVSPEVPVKELDLTDEIYLNSSRDDVKEFIHLFPTNNPKYADGIRLWCEKRNINFEHFVEQLADKSENNFMYLKYVLPEIARGFYDDLTLNKLPDGLQDYYQTHWVRMRMDNALNKVKVKILFTLVVIGTPTCEMIVDIVEQDKYDVQSILDEWFEYLKKQEIEEQICYSIYHTSFLDFLKGKKDLDSGRKLFQELNQRIADYLY